MAISPLGWHVTGLPGARELAAQGCSARQIAEALDLSELTVKRWAWRNRVDLPKYVHNVKPDHARMVELAEAGMTTTEIANELGCCFATVRNTLKNFGIVPLRKPQASGLRHMARAEKMASMYRQGLTLEKIGQKFGVTRERTRQILKSIGVNTADKPKKVLSSIEAKRARMDAASIIRWGVPHAGMKAARADGTLGAFVSQRNNARWRGIEWGLLFADWLTIWNASGKLALRGRGKGRYVMSRIKDEGGYRLGNVHIQESTENNSEGIAKCRHNKAQTPGVYKLYPGLAKPWVAKFQKRQLGMFATEAEATAARLDAERSRNAVSVLRGKGYHMRHTKDGSRRYEVMVRGKYIGTFKTPEEALAARAAALELKAA